MASCAKVFLEQLSLLYPACGRSTTNALYSIYQSRMSSGSFLSPSKVDYISSKASYYNDMATDGLTKDVARVAGEVMELIIIFALRCCIMSIEVSLNMYKVWQDQI